MNILIKYIVHLFPAAIILFVVLSNRRQRISFPSESAVDFGLANKDYFN